MKNNSIHGKIVAAVFMLPVMFVAHADTPKPARIAALEQGTVMSSKAQFSAVLAIAKAGKRLVTVGERGTIQVSDDSGVSWRQVPVPVSVTLTAVQFSDDMHGWAVGHMGVVLHTDDGGTTWIKQMDGVRVAKLALEAAKLQSGKPDAEKLLADAEQLVADGPDKPFLDVYFENAKTGYVLGAYNMILRTDDGGKSWRSWQAHVKNSKGLHLYSLRPAGGALFLAGEQGLLLKSADGGENFDTLESPYKGSFFGIVAGNHGEIVLYGLRGNAFRSIDQGLNWSKIEIGTKASISSGIQLDSGAMVLVSQAGDVLISRDEAKTFSALASKEQLPLTGVVQIPAPDGRTGMIVASLRGSKRLPFFATGTP